MRVQVYCFFFFFQAEDGIRDLYVTGVQTCALPISNGKRGAAVIRLTESGGDRKAGDGKRGIPVVRDSHGLRGRGRINALDTQAAKARWRERQRRSRARTG